MRHFITVANWHIWFHVVACMHIINVLIWERNKNKRNRTETYNNNERSDDALVAAVAVGDGRRKVKREKANKPKIVSRYSIIT